MISETFFASHYTSLWRVLTPAMDDFVRRINLEGYDRLWPPIASSTAAHRRGLLNEAAFLLFALLSKQAIRPPDAWVDSQIADCVDRAARYVNLEHGDSDQREASIEERHEIRELAIRIYTYHKTISRKPYEVSPSFTGCGIINACVGDVVINRSILLEVKAGDRSFRSLDYRQLLTYCALKWVKSKETYKNIELLNPRTGIHVSQDLEVVARSCSGHSSIELMDRIAQSFASGVISR